MTKTASFSRTLEGTCQRRKKKPVHRCGFGGFPNHVAAAKKGAILSQPFETTLTDGSNCVTGSLAVMIILLKPEDGDESSDYSSANESFLDEDPKSSNDPDVLGLVAQGDGTWEPGRFVLGIVKRFVSCTFPSFRPF